jgi:hypothetical protein
MILSNDTSNDPEEMLNQVITHLVQVLGEGPVGGHDEAAGRHAGAAGHGEVLGAAANRGVGVVYHDALALRGRLCGLLGQAVLFHHDALALLNDALSLYAAALAIRFRVSVGVD